MSYKENIWLFCFLPIFGFSLFILNKGLSMNHNLVSSSNKYYEINLPYLFGNPLSIYPILKKDFVPSLMTDFSSSIDKNTCEVVASLNLLRYYEERRRFRGLLIDGNSCKTFPLLDRSIGRLPFIGGQIGLGAMIGILKYLKKNKLPLPKRKKLIWPASFHWVKRNIERGRPVIIGLFHHKKYHHHAVLVLGVGENEKGRYYRIADGWNTTGSTLDKFLFVNEVLADGLTIEP